MALANGWCISCVLLCVWQGMPGHDANKWISCERGVMKRNEGSNERSGVKDRVAAVRNEPELQAA